MEAATARRRTGRAHAESPPGRLAVCVPAPVVLRPVRLWSWQRGPGGTQTVEGQGQPPVAEINVTLAEINHTLRHLRRRTRPGRGPVPAARWPSRSAWCWSSPPGSHPVQLLLNPLAGALAAGNAAVLKPSALAPATSAVITRLVPRYFPTAPYASRPTTSTPPSSRPGPASTSAGRQR
ncbi:aldehyde dehydrogenase family protein [Streptomyces sp. H27-S2]|nr:aldehyde dehydrogenase family protein [Streptomyces sp. H27-S2]MCY0954614.1 aldehyde dehydrogenase family protein [Streptomyces sp. H27-S2]